MKKWCVLVLFLMLSGCSKLGNFEQMKLDFRKECFGDHSVKCRVMLIDLNKAKLEAAIEAVSKSEERIVACKGQQAYDAGIQVIREKIDYYQDLKPNFFMRTLLSGTEVEFNPPSFKRERDFIEFLSSADSCKTAPANAAVQESSGQLDSNMGTPPAGLDTAAGRIAKTQQANGASAVTLGGNALFGGDDAQWQTPLLHFKLSGGRDAILLASSGGRGNSCETLFFFLVADNSGVKPSPEFGTCASQGSYVQRGDKIVITLPKMGGKSEFVFDGINVTEDGQVVQLQDSNDPSK